jgi:hypothetical protein
MKITYKHFVGVYPSWSLTRAVRRVGVQGWVFAWRGGW